MSVERDRRNKIESVYRENGRHFLARARQATRNTADAEDTVQDVFLHLLEHADVLDTILNLPAWIFRGVRNRIIDLWRHTHARRRAGETEVSEETIEAVMTAAGFDPADLYARSELVEALSAAVDSLPADQRDVIEAQVIEGGTFQELAERWRTPINTLMTRKRLAVEKLAAALRSWFGE